MTDDLFDTAPVVEPAKTPEPVPYTWSEQHRHECEVRMVRTMSYAHRKQYLEGVELWRGPEAAQRLREASEDNLKRRME